MEALEVFEPEVAEEEAPVEEEVPTHAKGKRLPVSEHFVHVLPCITLSHSHTPVSTCQDMGSSKARLNCGCLCLAEDTSPGFF